MKKIVVLGSTGMLGSKVYNHLNDIYDVYPSYKTEDLIMSEKSFYFDALKSDLSDIPKCDYVLNCIGVIKPFMKQNLANSIFINSVFPHKVSSYCKQHNIKLIHITTDCVFSGNTGFYSESSFHDCEDNYGKSKSIGEPLDCMVLRTSIIGEEIHKNASLIEWAKSNKNKKINGFTEHLWNGVTTKHYAEICHQIIEENLYQEGLYHIHSNDVSKFELLKIINDRFNLNIDIEPVKTVKVNRTLRSEKNLIKNLKIKSIKKQVQEL